MTAQENSELSYTLDEICGHAEDIKRLVEERDELRSRLSHVEETLEKSKTNLCQYVVDNEHVLQKVIEEEYTGKEEEDPEDGDEGTGKGSRRPRKKPEEDMNDYYDN